MVAAQHTAQLASDLMLLGVRKSTPHITLGRLKRGTYMTHLS